MAQSEGDLTALQPSGGRTVAQRSCVAGLLFSLCFTSNVIISLLYPFAPEHLSGQGYSAFFIGFLFAIYSWSILVSSPACAALVRWFGRDTMLSMGIVTLSIFSTTFGYAAELSFGSRPMMSTIYTASRILSGTGACLINLTVFSMAADTFPKDLGKIMGINEVVIGLGFTIGPPIGSILFVWTGFGPTFAIAAASVALMLPLAIFKGILDTRIKKQASTANLQEGLLQPGQGEEEDEGAPEGGFMRVVNTRVILSGVLCFCGTLVFGVVEPNLALHLKIDTGLSQTAIGGIFAVLAGTYTAVGVPIGWIADHHGYFLSCMIGVLVSGGTLVIMGADPIYKMVASALGQPLSVVILVKDVVLLAILGFGQAMLLVPTLPAMKGGVVHDDSASTEAVVTMFNCFQQLGLAVGPLVGAALVTNFGFGAALVATGAFLLSVGFVCLYHYCSYTSPREATLDSTDAGEDIATEPTVALLAGAEAATRSANVAIDSSSPPILRRQGSLSRSPQTAGKIR